MVGALALLALVWAGAAWVILSGGDSKTTTTTATPTVSLPAAVAADRRPSSTARASKAHPAKPSANRFVRLPRRGHPIIWLKRGARISMRTAPGGKVVKEIGWKTQFGSRTVFAVFGRQGGWAGVPTPLLRNGQLGWVKLDPSKIRAGWTRYAIDVDLSQRAAQLRVGKRVVRSFAVSIGAPGVTTPIGRFAVTDTFRGNLNPAYGCCAVATTATQPSLPSGWLGGNRIAIHGTVGPLGEAISHGCVRAANADVSALVTRVALGTPVVISQ
jgi:L,D-transpeptidase catalytic domain